MSLRMDKTWVVFASAENDVHDRCVDLFSRPDGTFGFEEFRRDIEDRGVWNSVSFFSGRLFPTKESAELEAARAVPWLAEALRRRR